MSDITGRGFWDVIDNNMIIIGTITIVGMWQMRGMWADWCMCKTTENIANVKLNKDKKKQDEHQ